MALTVIDEKPALVVIDLQKGITAMAGDLAGPVLERTQKLLRAFRAKGWTVALVNVIGRPNSRIDTVMNFNPPPDWAELVPELEVHSSDILVSKKSVGAFATTNIEEQLRSRGVTQLFVVGIATSVGVETIIRTSFDAGFNVVAVTDAMADRDPANHEHSVTKTFPRFAETATTEEVLIKIG